MKLCINCCTLHADEAVLCSACGTSLIKVPAREETGEMRKASQAGHPEGARPSDTTGGSGPGPLQTAASVGGGLFLCLIGLMLEQPSFQSMGLILIGLVLAGVAAVWIWQAAMRLGARLADGGAGTGRGDAA
jgi:hypothetical protein